ncbi:hypothetical protein GPZ77_21465 [Streptomyces sp. QHH-9511]|uniref:hypothetical protein n=1 Tax=Streptomyces sp. QHH-9511 TaxID=2684468 RepID=UPI0013179618|nr:hypothetical protein [Streptomyces sp. QHH-9511]QGZ50593.1 hypothetical protein GPZ77_21465 [Streptomyces sp. QHH-9511]
MADERYQWLDQEAAERLLRGEPVDPVDDHARAQAERLADALAAARPVPFPRAAEAELPGEAAALAAFRKATAERAAACAAPSAELGGVRLAPVSPARRWGRSLRYGLAAAVAAVAVGGVAVASGTGMLPFDRDAAPTPAGSVSAVDTPEPRVSGTPDDGLGTEVPTVPPTAGGRSPGASSSPATPPAVAGSGGTDGTGGKSGGTPEPDRSKGSPEQDGETTAAANVRDCREYRAGRLDDSGVRRLVKEVRSGETVRRFCDRVLSGGSDTGDSSGDTNNGSTGGTSGAGSSGGKGDGKGDDDSAGEGDRAGGASGGAGGKSTGGKSTGGKSTGGKGGGDRGSDRRSDRNTGLDTGPEHAAAPVGRASTAAVEPAPSVPAETVTHQV